MGEGCSCCARLQHPWVIGEWKNRGKYTKQTIKHVMRREQKINTVAINKVPRIAHEKKRRGKVELPFGVPKELGRVLVYLFSACKLHLQPKRPGCKIF
jgi:hypothetical protein